MRQYIFEGSGTEHTAHLFPFLPSSIGYPASICSPPHQNTQILAGSAVKLRYKMAGSNFNVAFSTCLHFLFG